MVETQSSDPAEVRLGNGRSMADLMRRGPHNLRGVVVKATPGGVTENCDPHNRSRLEVHIEPEGCNATFTMDKVTNITVAEALAHARLQVQGGSIEAIRERTAVAFEQLAKIANSGVKRTQADPDLRIAAERQAEQRRANVAAYRDNGESPPRDDENAVLQELRATAASLSETGPALPPVEKIDRSYSPMAAFGLKKAPMAANTLPIIAKSASSGPPEKLVYFEKEGIGTVPAFFHDVLVHVARPEPDNPEEAGFMVLVYDVRSDMSAARWFPPSNDPYQRPWAAKISDDNRLYLVHTTGFQYIYDSREYCVLSVEKAMWALEGAE